MTAALTIAVAYLIGAIPFGYLIARAKGVDLFRVGSGNIGATNVGRVLGRKYGILVFLLDFLKGAGPVAVVPLLPVDSDINRDWLRVGAALAAFLGHLFPIYLKFRGGKGVATGAGTVFMLVPGPAALALLVWLATVSAFRIVSLASLIAALTLIVARLLAAPPDHWIVTGYCMVAVLFVVVKHRANLVRLWNGNENRLEEKPVFAFWHRALHLLALALWLGSIVFFNLLAAPAIFESFKEVAQAEPGDRTAFININAGLDDAQKKSLGSALAGAAVGPIFPKFFALQAICGTLALVTAFGWWKQPGKANRWRIWIIGLGWVLVVVSWPISQKVTELRLARFSPDTTIAAQATADFAAWHVYSLTLSLLTIICVFAATVLAANLPERRCANTQ